MKVSIQRLTTAKQSEKGRALRNNPDLRGVWQLSPGETTGEDASLENVRFLVIKNEQFLSGTSDPELVAPNLILVLYQNRMYGATDYWLDKYFIRSDGSIEISISN